MVGEAAEHQESCLHRSGVTKACIVQGMDDGWTSLFRLPSLSYLEECEEGAVMVVLHDNHGRIQADGHEPHDVGVAQ